MTDYLAYRSQIVRIGREDQPVSIVDGFAADPDALRDAAIAATFEPAAQHYPGIRAPLPAEYLRAQLPVVAQALARNFGRFRRIHVIDASFSIVTSPAAALLPRQRLPHVDAYGTDRIALVHYLGLDTVDGTAFYRHRATGFETVDDTRADAYFAAVGRETDEVAPPPGYIAGDTPTFACIERIDARYNRALLYRSYALHSGAIAADASLSSDPARGRLTVTGFFALE